MNVVRIGCSADDVIQRLLDDYVKSRGAVAATAIITFEDGSQIKLHGSDGEATPSAEMLRAVGL